MKRYEFENLISDYLEGDLSYNKREEFELHLEGDEDAKLLVQTVERTMNQMKKVDKISTSKHFNSTLLSKIKDKTPIIIRDKSSIFGFTPYYASVFSFLCFAAVIIFYSLIAPGFDSSSNAGYSMSSDNTPSKVVKSQSFNDNDFTSDSKKDSLNRKNKDYEPKKTNKIKFVNY